MIDTLEERKRRNDKILSEYFSGQTDVALEILSLMENTLPAWVSGIRESQDPATTAGLLHTSAPSFKILGMNDLAARCFDLESRIRKGTFEEAEILTITGEMQESLSAIHQLKKWLVKQRKQ